MTRILSALGGLALMVGAAVALVWPVWYLATAHTRLYTWLCIAAMAGFAAWVVAGRIRKARRPRRKPAAAPAVPKSVPPWPESPASADPAPETPERSEAGEDGSRAGTDPTA